MFAAFVERGIVPCRDIIAAVFEGELEHRAELYLSVADDTGVRSRSAQIFGGKIVHDLFFELAAQVEYAVLYFKSLRHIFRVLNVAVRAVAGLQAQCYTHDIISALFEQSRGNGAVNSAAHPYKYALQAFAPFRFSVDYTISRPTMQSSLNFTSRNHFVFCGIFLYIFCYDAF